jgi:hypothetical protein
MMQRKKGRDDHMTEGKDRPDPMADMEKVKEAIDF